MSADFRPGSWVEVKSKSEILRTLDADGTLEGMLFMPEMFQYCGQRFRVYKSAHKSCDYTTLYPYRTRRIKDAVLLETRCDGSAHGGCQAGCTIIWKKAWLQPVAADAPTTAAPQRTPNNDMPVGGCTEDTLLSLTQAPDPADGKPRYFCQATEIQKGSTPLNWWDLRQYVEDVWSGNVTLKQLGSALVYTSYFHLSQAGIGIGPAMRWLYNRMRWLWGGSKWPRTPGRIPEGEATPAKALNLQPGELVRVRPHEDILETVTTDNRNRGMFWDAELVPYCGGTYKVLRRVTKLIGEQTGKMMEMKTPCIILDSVVCQARYSQCRMLCPRAMYPYWREIWLERVNTSGES